MHPQKRLLRQVISEDWITEKMDNVSIDTIEEAGEEGIQSIRLTPGDPS
jgi:hypothetical protein